MHSLSKQQRTFFYLFGGVLVLHMAFMLIKFRDDFARVTFKPEPEVIKLTFLPESAPSATAIPQASKLVQKKQIVQSEESANNERPKDSAFLSDKDRTFDRQTIAKKVDIFKNTGLGDAKVTRNAEKAPEVSKQASTKPRKEVKLSDLGLGMVEPLQEVTRAPASESKAGMKSGDASTVGFSATNDYVQEVGLGDFTHLNTTEYKFYGFFHRIRQKLEQFWGKSIAEKANNIFRSGRSLASEDYITSLQITLNAKGEIVNVKILGASGVKELDDAAIESFNQAGPFPNPPQDLLVNGKAVIEWGFVVKG